MYVEQQPPSQSPAPMQFWRQLNCVPLALTAPQVLPAQQFCVFVQSAPTGVQLQYRASTQNPPGAFENIRQQLLKQSELVVHEGRHPAKSGLDVPVTHVPLQHWMLFVQAFPCCAHALEHAVAGAHSRSPVLLRSVQQLLLQSAPVWQVL